MTRVVYESWGQRVVFGSGTAREDVAAEVAGLGASRVLVIAADEERALAEDICKDAPVVAVFGAVRPHVPADVAEAVRAAARDHDADLLLSVGGGSTTGTAKAAALTTGLPILAVPTTYAGSEATPVWGLTEDGHKRTGVDSKVLPGVVVYDATLTLSLPTRLSVTSGLNALAHCVDAWWAPRHNPISSALAVEGVRSLASALPRVVADGQDVAARRQMLFGTYLAAVAFAGAGSGLHHKVCHVLGGAYDLDHAALHSVVLPHVVGLNLAAAPEAARHLGAALDAPTDPFAALLDLYASVEPPCSLSELGLTEEELDRAADLVMAQVPDSNPRRVTRDEMRGLLARAWRGDTPTDTPPSCERPVP
ncbi:MULTISPECIES: maleylacetate reductase [Streptomyces]|uniref:maleylacetate reductase n=1 Tax=Streptomyces TaxID=1883 RepID=UPI000A3CCAC7|nr:MULTISPECIES: maleylacetate reductase [Streptomyces]MDX3612802.1 maleylacetate reductase [Streptomyces europaeiscabiei]MDX3636213.1 maleylacetate reductase [Streptomyces europaeiscabiei]MDX3654209.1 maleylacetate reductase [Streptomyces europaeiscabiei]